MKCIEYQSMEDVVPSSVLRELSMLKELKHDNVIKGSSRTDMNPRAIKRFLFQILQGLSYCHSFNVLQRDLKPGNLLVPSSVLREISVLKELKHDNVINYGSQGSTHKSVHYPLEFLELLASPPSESFLFQILQGLSYCHSRNVLHRDLKPGDLLVPSSVLREISAFKELKHDNFINYGSTKVHKSVHYPLEVLVDRELLASPSSEEEAPRGINIPISNHPLPWFLILQPMSEQSEFFSPLTRETRTTTRINTLNNYEIAGQSTPHYQSGNWFIMFERVHGKVCLFDGEHLVQLPNLNLNYVPIEGAVLGFYRGNPLVEGNYHVLLINSKIPDICLSLFNSSHPKAEEGWMYHWSKHEDNRPEEPMGPLTHSHGFSYVDRMHEYLMFYDNMWDFENSDNFALQIVDNEGNVGALRGMDMICLYAREGEMLGMVTHTPVIDEDTDIIIGWRYDIYRFNEVINPHNQFYQIRLSPYRVLPTENLFASPYGPGTLTNLPIDHRIGVRQNLFLGGFHMDCRRFSCGQIPLQQGHEILKNCSHLVLGRCGCRAYLIITDFGDNLPV